MTIDTTAQPLAIHGGPRALAGDPSPWPILDENVRLALDRVWADGSWGRYHGPHTRQLEAELAALHDVEFVTLCCSGTFAVELALRGAGIGPGDEVILAGYDFPGNFRAIEATGARPVLVDVDRDGWLLNLDELSGAVGQRTRAVVASHLHGHLVDMPRLVELARQHGLFVVEDACQAAGARIGGRVAGSWGDAGVLSFGGSKLLTAGRGGALLTRQADIHQRAKIFCHRGNHAFPLSELQAAVLLPQLQQLDERNEQRRANAQRLMCLTTELPALRGYIENKADARASYYKLAWQFCPEALHDCPIDDLIAALQAEGVPCDRGFRGFAGRSQRRCRKAAPLVNSLRAAEATLLLHHPILLASPTVIDALADAIRKVVRGLNRERISE